MSFTILSNNGLCINPNINLISNIGFDSAATHTNKTNDKLANLKTYEFSKKIIHPNFILPDMEAEKYTYTNHYNLKLKSKWWKKIFNAKL